MEMGGVNSESATPKPTKHSILQMSHSVPPHGVDLERGWGT